jgi:hypothetical protein
MAEMNGRGVYKARKTPLTIYPASPPQLSTGIEVVYHSIATEIRDQTTAEFRDKIVTSQILYKPAILAGARIKFHGNRWQLHLEKDILRVVPFPSKHQFCDWNTNLHPKWDARKARSTPEPEALFLYDSTYDFSSGRFDELQDDFRNHLLSTVAHTVEYNPHFKLQREQQESDDSFMARCMERARAEFNKESQNVEETLHRMRDRLKQRLDREMRGMEGEEQDETERHDSNVAIKQINKEMEALTDLRKTKMNELEENLTTIANEREKDVLRLKPQNLAILRFTLVWLPYTEYVIQEDDSRRLQLIQSF